MSVMFHVAVVLASLVVSAHQPSRRLEPVTVVNLVGGSDIPYSPPNKAVPQGAPPLAAKTLPAEPVSKGDIPVKKAQEKQEKKEPEKSVKKKAPDIDPNAMASVSERVQRMREERENENSVRKAIEERRNTAAAREAVRGVGERVARRIESPSSPVVRDLAAGSGGGYGGGSRGTVRVSPEMTEFYNRLEERVRENWILPEALVREASGLMVQVRITIEKDGRVSDTRIEKGSGNVYFDESVRRAIQKASPLPVPPERLRGGEDHYEVGFRFHGTGGKG